MRFLNAVLVLLLAGILIAGSANAGSDPSQPTEGEIKAAIAAGTLVIVTGPDGKLVIKPTRETAPAGTTAAPDANAKDTTLSMSDCLYGYTGIQVLVTETPENNCPALDYTGDQAKTYCEACLKAAGIPVVQTAADGDTILYVNLSASEDATYRIYGFGCEAYVLGLTDFPGYVHTHISSQIWNSSINVGTADNLGASAVEPLLKTTMAQFTADYATANPSAAGQTAPGTTTNGSTPTAPEAGGTQTTPDQSANSSAQQQSVTPPDSSSSAAKANRQQLHP